MQSRGMNEMSNSNDPPYERKGARPGEQLRKLFIGGLTTDANEEHLRELYGQYGELEDCVVMRDPNTKKSRCFGFITYTDQTMVDEAQNHRPHIICGRTVEAKRAVPKELAHVPGQHQSVKKCFIGGIRGNLNKESITRYLEKFGNLQSVDVMTDKNTGKPRGFGFAAFDDYDAVDKLVQIHMHTIDGIQVEIKKAASREEMKTHDGSGMGMRMDGYGMSPGMALLPSGMGMGAPQRGGGFRRGGFRGGFNSGGSYARGGRNFQLPPPTNMQAPGLINPGDQAWMGPAQIITPEFGIMGGDQFGYGEMVGTNAFNPNVVSTAGFVPVTAGAVFTQRMAGAPTMSGAIPIESAYGVGNAGGGMGGKFDRFNQQIKHESGNYGQMQMAGQGMASGGMGMESAAASGNAEIDEYYAASQAFLQPGVVAAGPSGNSFSGPGPMRVPPGSSGNEMWRTSPYQTRGRGDGRRGNGMGMRR